MTPQDYNPPDQEKKHQESESPQRYTAVESYSRGRGYAATDSYSWVTAGRENTGPLSLANRKPLFLPTLEEHCEHAITNSVTLPLEKHRQKGSLSKNKLSTNITKYSPGLINKSFEL